MYHDIRRYIINLLLPLGHISFSDVPPPRCPEASAPSLAHATATKQGSGQQRAASSPTYVPWKVAPPNTSPTEPSPEHGPDQAGLHCRVDDDEDAR